MFKGFSLSEPTGKSTAVILPEYGFNCISWQVQTEGGYVELLDTLPGFTEGTLRPSSSGIPILFPFPNRIRDGEFTCDGQTYQLPKNNQNKHAIHGFVLDRPFRVISHTANSITGCFQLSVDAPDRITLWPADFILEVTYTLEHSTLTANFVVKNPAASSGPNLPWGLGIHPYFKLPLAGVGNAADCEVLVEADDYWELQENIPTGKILPVNEQLDLRQGKRYADCQFDDVLTHLKIRDHQVESMLIDPECEKKIIQTADSLFQHLVVFTPVNRAAICLEPYTCVTNSINLILQGIKETGWQELPGAEAKTLQIKWEFQEKS